MSYYKKKGRGNKSNEQTPLTNTRNSTIQADLEEAANSSSNFNNNGGTTPQAQADETTKTIGTGGGTPQMNIGGNKGGTGFAGTPTGTPLSQQIGNNGTAQYAQTVINEPVAAVDAAPHRGTTFRPPTITVSNLNVKLTSISDYTTFKTKLLAQAKMGGYIEYLEINSIQHWLMLAQRYRDVDSEALYAYYRDNHTKISGALQIAVADLIPNFDVLEAQIVKENPSYMANVPCSAAIGGAFATDNANLIWNKLLVLYDRKSVYNVATLWQQLVSLTYNEQTDPSVYHANIQALWSRLNEQLSREPVTAGNVMPESLLVAIMLQQLPKQLQYIMTILDTNNKVTPHNIISQLQLKYIQTHPQTIKLAKQLNTTNSGTKSGSSGGTSAVEANYANQEPNERGSKPRWKKGWKKGGKHYENGENSGSSRSGGISGTNGVNHQKEEQEKFKGKKITYSEPAASGYSAVDNVDEVLASCVNSDNDSDDDVDDSFLNESAQYGYALDDNFDAMWTLKLDSGATRHIIGNPKLFDEGSMKKPPFKFSVKGLFGAAGTVTAVGSIRISKNIQLNNVWYIHGAKTNLISVSRITQQKGTEVIFHNETASIMEQGYEAFTFTRDSVGLYTWKHPLGSHPDHGEEEPHYFYNRSSTAKGPRTKSSYKKIPKRNPDDVSRYQTSNSGDESASKAARDAVQNERSKRKSQEQKANYASGYLAIENSSTSNGGTTGGTNSGGDLTDSLDMHYRLGHTTITEQVAAALGLKAGAVITATCDTCLVTKTTRTKTGTGTYEHAKAPFERINVDVMGPISIRNTSGKGMLRQPSLGSNNYVLVMIDEFSRFVWTRLLVSKSDAAAHIISLVKHIKTQFGVTVKQIHSDLGGEFKNTELENFLASTGTKQTFTTAYSPMHNGQAERMNRKLAQLVKAMLIHSGVSVLLWGEAMSYATYVHNRTPIQGIGNKTPFGVITGTEPKMNKLHVFGSNVIMNTSGGTRTGKFQTPNVKAIFVGVSEQHNGYRVYDGTNVLVTRDVRIINHSFTYVQALQIGAVVGTSVTELHISTNTDETDEDDCDMYNTGASSGTKEPLTVNGGTPPKEYNYDQFDDHTLSPIQEEDFEEELDNETVTSNDNLVNLQNSNSISTKAGRNIQSVLRYGSIDPRDLDPMSRQQLSRETGGGRGYCAVYSAEHEEILIAGTDDNDSVAYEINAGTTKIVDPVTYKEAINGVDAKKWETSIAEEITALKREQVLEEVVPPKGVKLLNTKWVFKQKTDDQNRVIKYKSRLVVKGYTQIAGVDFNDTFAPVAKAKTIKLLLAIAAAYGMELRQIDFKNAFLNSNLPEDIYIAVPEGYTAKPGMVFKLKKSLYGLKQAPFLWNATISKLLIKLGYTQAVSDPCVYYKYTSGCSTPIIVSVYVDDVMILFQKEQEPLWNQDKQQISAAYPIDDIGPLDWILKMKVTRTISGDITLSQRAYSETLVNDFYSAGTDAGTTGNPNIVSVDLTDAELLTKRGATPLAPSEHERYRSIVGALNYLANTTRIDITFIVNLLCRAVAAPTTAHMKAAINVIKYIKGTLDYCLTFYSGGGNGLTITGYSDADYGGDKNTRKSTSGSIVKLNNSIITWNTRKQSTVALSTMEAEYVALVNTACDTKWIQAWIKEVLKIVPPITLFCDNQSTIHILDKDDHHATTKHMDIKLHFIRDYVKRRIIRVRWISTNDQIADILTKSLSTVRHATLVKMVMANTTNKV